MGDRHTIGCVERNERAAGLRPLSSITNWINGEVIDWEKPPITATTWGLDDGTEVLRDELDADGCRHWLIDPEVPDA